MNRQRNANQTATKLQPSGPSGCNQIAFKLQHQKMKTTMHTQPNYIQIATNLRCSLDVNCNQTTTTNVSMAVNTCKKCANVVR